MEIASRMGMKTIRHISLGVLLLFLAFPMGARGMGSDSTAQARDRLFDLVNAGRANPLETIGRFGLDPEKALADLPELEQILRNGLPPLARSATLDASAESHVRDMIERKYYDEINPEGETAMDRAIRHGYPAASVAENLGLLAFLNFMDPDAAAERVFENMFRDELRPDRESPRGILGENGSEIGIGFGSSRAVFDGKTFNTYLFACDFGKRLFSGADRDVAISVLLQLLNQARSNPLAVAEAAGLDPALFAGFAGGVSALDIHPALRDAAAERLSEMTASGFRRTDSPDGRSPLDRAVDAGYPGDASVTESPVWVPVNADSDIFDVAGAFFDRLFEREAEILAEGGEPILLNPNFRSVGIAPGHWHGAGEDGIVQSRYGAVLDFGTRATESSPFVHLSFFWDADGDGLYSAGEGIPEFGFEAIGYDTGVFPPAEFPGGLLLTDSAGGLSVPAFRGVHVFRSDFGAGLREWVRRVGAESAWIPIRLAPGDSG